MKDLIKKEKYTDIWSDKLSIPIPSLDIVIFTIYRNELCIVLQQNKNKYALPGGIIASGYSLEKNFDTILERETGIKGGVYAEQLYTFGDPKRDKRGHVISIAYYALAKADSFLSEIDLTKVDLVKYSDLEKAKTMYDHKKIINYAKQRLSWKIEYTNIAGCLLPSEFRISKLQEIYEIVLSKKIDKRNFQKKILKLKMIEETGKLDKSTNRPAKLYKFVDSELEFYGVV